MSKQFILILITVLALVFIAGIFKGSSDVLQFKYSQSIFSNEKYDQTYFNPDLSWKNKYLDYDGGNKSEAFWGSAGALVFLTDAWHLFQMLEALAWTLALLFSLRLGYLIYASQRVNNLVVVVSAFVLLYLFFHTGFVFTYDWILLL